METDQEKKTVMVGDIAVEAVKQSDAPNLLVSARVPDKDERLTTTFYFHDEQGQAAAFDIFSTCLARSALMLMLNNSGSTTKIAPPVGEDSVRVFNVDGYQVVAAQRGPAGPNRILSWSVRFKDMGTADVSCVDPKDLPENFRGLFPSFEDMNEDLAKLALVNLLQALNDQMLADAQRAAQPCDDSDEGIFVDD